MKDKIETNQNSYNKNKDHTKQSIDQGLQRQPNKQWGLTCTFTCMREKRRENSTDHCHISGHIGTPHTAPGGRENIGESF